MTLLYEDNHIIIINKTGSELVQGDKTGDATLIDSIKDYLRVTYGKPGNIFCGVVHRLDRPTTGIVVFAKTSKALSRLNEMFKKREVVKTYWAITAQLPYPKQATLRHWLVRNEKQNKSVANDVIKPQSKEAILHYNVLYQSDRYTLCEIKLETGRHHQIRSQFAKIGCSIKGDLKYGYPRSNPDGSISLHARSICFTHPISKKEIKVVAPVPDDKLWKYFESKINNTINI